MQFLEFFIWGSWLISLGNYMGNLDMGDHIGPLFATAGFAAIIMPAIVGIIADRWLNSEKLLGILHLLGACCLFMASKTGANFNELYLYIFLNALVFMPTIGLSYSVCYSIMANRKMDTLNDFPPIRTWGTVGFIVAMWIVSLAGWELSANQLVLASASALVLGVYSFTLPPSPPTKVKKGSSLISTLGLDAVVLLKQRKMAIFFLFSVLLGVCLQITNSFGSLFLSSFRTNYEHSFAVLHANIILSISQISEALFILAIPFFMRRFGIKTVILMSFGAWVLRFGLFGFGNPTTGLIWLILSMIVYGMAFDFFNISGSLFIEKETPPKFRASAQGLFMMVTNGLGAVIGNYSAQAVINYHTNGKETDWPTCWFIFAGYALVIGILFALCFRYKTVPART